MGTDKTQQVTLARVRAVDRHRLQAWLVDKARDEDETAEHVARTFTETSNEHVAGSFIASTLEVDFHRERARCFRSVAAALDREEPDGYWPPDLSGRARKGESVSGEHLIDRARIDKP